MEFNIDDGRIGFVIWRLLFSVDYEFSTKNGHPHFSVWLNWLTNDAIKLISGRIGFAIDFPVYD